MEKEGISVHVINKNIVGQAVKSILQKIKHKKRWMQEPLLNTLKMQITNLTEIFTWFCGHIFQACEKTCYQRYVIENCTCAVPQYPKYGRAFDYVNVSTCSSSDREQSEYIHYSCLLIDTMFKTANGL